MTISSCDGLLTIPSCDIIFSLLLDHVTAAPLVLFVSSSTLPYITDGIATLNSFTFCATTTSSLATFDPHIVTPSLDAAVKHIVLMLVLSIACSSRTPLYSFPLISRAILTFLSLISYVPVYAPVIVPSVLRIIFLASLYSRSA